MNFKSIGSDTARLRIRPLTILAGANSSGKSTLLQPLLLMKQSFESPFAPAGLLLDGPNVTLSDASQVLSLVPGASRTIFRWGFEMSSRVWYYVSFEYDRKDGLVPTVIDEEDQTGVLSHLFGPRNLFARGSIGSFGVRRKSERQPDIADYPYFRLSRLAIEVVHVSGTRGNRQRNYPRTAVHEPFQGTFEPYVASVIHDWQQKRDEKLDTLVNWLTRLDLTNSIEARLLNDVSIELRVNRLPVSSNKSASKRDLVSISDVGRGVSEALPGLVAILAAGRSSTVYLEQPELHLHPNPQVKLAHVLAEASKRGPSIIVETHSALLLREIQTLVASGELDPANVSLNWCSRNSETGATVVQQAELTKDGTYGEWPTDFDSIALESEGRFLDAVALSRNK